MKRECIHRGCHELVANGSRCPKHNRHTIYKAQRTDTEYQRFYTSTGWRKVREMTMRRDLGLCVRCMSNGIPTKAQTVHHLVYLKHDYSKRLELSNLVSVCESCHQWYHRLD